METVWIGRADVRGMTVEYYRIEEPAGRGRTDYGVEISTSLGEHSRIGGITVSPEEIVCLLDRLVRNSVTPATLRDVIDDWLA